MLNVIERLRRNCTITANDCWLWTGHCNPKGYGVISIGERFYAKRRQLVHRVAWRIWRGDIPDGLFVLHECDTPACFNPLHLWLGTKADNNADCMCKGRRAHAAKAR